MPRKIFLHDNGYGLGVVRFSLAVFTTSLQTILSQVSKLETKNVRFLIKAHNKRVPCDGDLTFTPQDN